MTHILNRKNKLWEGSRMFLPEHRAALQQQRQAAQKFTPPILNEDQLAEMNWTLSEALAEGFPLIIYDVKRDRSRQQSGFVQQINLQHRWLLLVNGGTTTKVALDTIYRVERM
ncbi:YolD-like family protein [Hazenella sp. IB182357]|uniref:YolD-like family protein n=1 Tax=Polycladospora coralii TaxID=2771432 RepID=A0A926RUW8_9BACL|nr:YolD-like family protein [Polycladospora coralii]MBD1373112.1 YolD-like family protein [Polycladospora coralii]MBS7531670.1 YolD-like family protein [Polycladospora coralii]